MIKHLEAWRIRQAQKEGVPLFRVLPRQAIHDIVISKISTREGLLSVKGIKEKKLAKYGEQILEIINQVEQDKSFETDKEQVYSVSSFLELINKRLTPLDVQIKGEVSSLETRDNYAFFSLKDKGGESLVRCFVWRDNLELSGVSIQDGSEIVVEGFPEVYKPSGSLTFKVRTLSLVGEGALKQAYEELRNKLEKEGLFDESRKKSLKNFPQKIGLITSRDGAVINDFLSNLGQFGYKIEFVNSRVEGQRALTELLSAIKHFRTKDLDALVIIRGGGSFESFLAFNNEAVVRVVASFPVPVICGLGHDKDIPLTALAADVCVSTPTATTSVLNESWVKISMQINLFSQKIQSIFSNLLAKQKMSVYKNTHALEEHFANMSLGAREVENKFKVHLVELVRTSRSIHQSLELSGSIISNFTEKLCSKLWKEIKMSAEKCSLGFKTLQDRQEKEIQRVENHLLSHDPQRLLRLGYSLVRRNGKIIASVRALSPEEKVSLVFYDGDVVARIEENNYNQKNVKRKNKS